jgi:DNA-binding GntR family transcriptional regulator
MNDPHMLGLAGELPPIERRSLHSEVSTRLRDMIIEGHLPPGARINEGLVGKQLGVSRTPLREAIKSLVSEGLVEIIQGKGASVRSLSERELIDILEALKLIEQHAGRLVCERGDAAAIAAIEALHAEMMGFYAAKARLPYFKRNQDIHSAIVRASGNAVLAELHETLQLRIKRLRYIGNEGPEKWAGAVAEHEEMIESLRKRDGKALARILGKHLDATLQRVRGSLSR